MPNGREVEENSGHFDAFCREQLGIIPPRTIVKPVTLKQTKQTLLLNRIGKTNNQIK